MQLKNGICVAMIAGAAAMISACADYGSGGNYGTVGVGFAGYDGPAGFGSDYYGGLGYPGYGYYNDFYYPGYGSYVFDRGGHRREWNESERQHWGHVNDGHPNGYRGLEHGRVAQAGQFDRGRDRGFMADRQQSYRAFQQQARGGGQGHGAPQGGRPGGGQPGGGQHGGGDHGGGDHGRGPH